MTLDGDTAFGEGRTCYPSTWRFVSSARNGLAAYLESGVSVDSQVMRPTSERYKQLTVAATDAGSRVQRLEGRGYR
jgi:hypothetical protein